MSDSEAFGSESEAAATDDFLSGSEYDSGGEYDFDDGSEEINPDPGRAHVRPWEGGGRGCASWGRGSNMQGMTAGPLQCRSSRSSGSVVQHPNPWHQPIQACAAAPHLPPSGPRLPDPLPCPLRTP